MTSTVRASMPRLKKPDPLAKAIGRRVRELLRERGLTQEKLAYENDLSKATLSDMMKGLARPSIVTLNRIAKALGVELLDLFTRPADDDRHRLIDLTRSASASSLRAMASALVRDQRRS